MNARIVERTRQDGSKRYVIQKRLLWVWFDHDEEYATIQEAKKKMCFHDGTKIVDRVVGGESQRDPDPATADFVGKLRDLFKARLDREDDPDAFLESMRPMVLHERRDFVPYAVNEAPGKLYVFDNPVRWGRSILVDGDFAQKVLAMNGFPN